MLEFFTTMRRHIKNTLIPHEGNDHRPHLLRPAGILLLVGIILIAFAFSLSRSFIFNKSSEFTAAVLPGVLVALANEDRATEALPELAVNPLLEEAARMKAEHMAANGYFAHKSPDGLDPWYWFYRAGYDFVDAGENLAVNFSDSKDVERAWMKSPGHRANIMNGTFTEIGIASVPGTYKGKETIFVVQMFGRPASAAVRAPIAVVPPAPTIPSVVSTQEQTPTPIFVEEDTAEEGTLIKTDMSARVEGITALSEKPAASVPAEDVRGAAVSAWDTATAHPRATVSWVYVGVSLLISFVLLCMVFTQVHHRHTRSMIYGIVLLVLISLLSYLNWLLVSADLIIV